jgi:thioredoxin 1
MSAAIQHLNSAEFQKAISTPGTPILVDFWAEWCGPCKMIAPILDELASELQGKLRIAKVDVDKNQDLAGAFQVQAIPTLLLFKDGQIATRIVGMVNKARLKSELTPFL